MREMKFRLRVGDKVVGYEKWSPLGGWFYSTDGLCDWNNKYIPHTDKDQFTGLCDKKGKEAYFEDLYKISGSDKVYHISKSFDYSQMCNVETLFKYCRAEIIGNMFQNPELLEKKT